MNAFVRPARHVFVPIDEIDLSHAIRPYNATVVAELAQSIRAIGLQTPLTCVIRDGRHILVAGRNRLEALRTIGAEQAPVRIVDFSDIEAQLWQFSENLHRAELTKLEYDRQVVRYAELLKVKLAGEAGTVRSRLSQKRQSEAEGIRGKLARISAGVKHWRITLGRPRAEYSGADGSPRLSDRIAIAGSAGSGGRDGPGRQ